MREVVDRDRVARVAAALGEAADRDVRIYFTGGVTAVLMGWRPSTVDIDLIAVPDSGALMRAIPALHARDRSDVQEMVSRGLVDGAAVRQQFVAMEPELYRFPAIDPPTFRRAVDEVFPPGPAT